MNTTYSPEQFARQERSAEIGEFKKLFKDATTTKILKSINEAKKKKNPYKLFIFALQEILIERQKAKRRERVAA